MLIRSIANVLNGLEKCLIGTMALAAIILVVIETVLRYAAPAHLTDWSGEVTVYLIGWALMLSLPHLVAREKHVRADLLHHQFSPAVRWFLDVCATVIGIVFCATILWAGIDIVSFGMMFGEISDSSLQFPMWVFYLAVPVGFGTSLLRYLVLLISKLMELRTSPTAS